MKRRSVKLIAVLTILFLPSLCFGADVGVTSTQVMAGYVISPAVFGTSSRPDLNYVMTNVRVEWMRFEKNFRMLTEATYSKTTTGPSGYLIGGTLLLRYDFEPIGKLLPYAQVGPVFYTPICTRITLKTLWEMKLNSTRKPVSVFVMQSTQNYHSMLKACSITFQMRGLETETLG